MFCTPIYICRAEHSGGILQFMNKVLYAREGAKSIMDRTFADFPWQVRVEVDGVEIEVPDVSVEDFSAVCVCLVVFKLFAMFIMLAEILFLILFSILLNES